MILHGDHGMLDVGISMRRELYTRAARQHVCAALAVEVEMGAHHTWQGWRGRMQPQVDTWITNDSER